jgi:G3E family GTPase
MNTFVLSLAFLWAAEVSAFCQPVIGIGFTFTTATITASASSSSKTTNSNSNCNCNTLLGASTISEELAQELDEYDDDGIIPITVISGFLGSGKTTLLQHLLENKSGDCPVGVIVNDVADVNIDGKLVSAMESADGSSDGLVELENGCACCALSDELLSGVSELVTLSDLRRGNGGGGPNGHLKPFKHIVVEMSGVSDPRNIRSTFQEAEQSGMVLMSRIRLDTMVTVVDAEMFESYFKSEKTASVKESPELFRKEEQDFEVEDWMEDVPPELLKAILGHRGVGDEGDSNGVGELLVGQTETADVILLNKCDLLAEGSSDDSDKKLQRLRDLIKALNPRPTTSVLESSYGKVALSSILGVAKGEGVVMSGAVDDHREFVEAAVAATDVAVADAASSVEVEGCSDPSCSECGDGESVGDSDFGEALLAIAIEEENKTEEASMPTGCTDPACSDPACSDSTTTDSHEHSHDHSPDPKIEAVTKSSGCTDPACSDPSCSDAPIDSHEHSHDHSPAPKIEESSGCTDPACSDPSCSDAPVEAIKSSSTECTDPACSDPACSDETHSHSHSHNDHASDASNGACNDPGCTEDHDHSHSHAHSHSHEENSTHAGIGTFVYRARRPFHPQRMLSFLRTMPIARGIPEAEEEQGKEITTASSTNNILVADDSSRETLSAVLRSKGFVWCADSHSNSMYWSHAGASFEYKCLGRWWATLPRDEWPEGVDEYVLRDFDDVHHPSEGVVSDGDDVVQIPESVGDRRQEVVFIGLGFGKASKQRDIRETLDKCLLSEKEYDEYRSICFEKTGPAGDPDGLLQDRFPSAIESDYINY